MYIRNIVSVLFLFFWLQTDAQVQFEGLKQINGTEIYLKVIGRGEPLLIMHGGPGMSHDYFLPHLEVLAKKHTLIFFDQRSAGKSELSLKEQMNFGWFARDIDSIRVALGYDKIHLFGHSWGGLIAVHYALHYPDHVVSMILCNSVPMNHDFDREMISNQNKKFSVSDSLRKAAIVESEDFNKGKTAAVEQLMLLTFKTSFCDTSKIEALHLNLPENYVVASLSYYGFAKDLQKYDFFPMMPSLKMPVLILHGHCDNMPLEADKKIQNLIPASQLYVFESAGHFPFIEQDKLFVKKVNKFLHKNRIAKR